jgi:hypothetical protein
LGIRVTIDVNLEGEILITAEEVESGVSEKTAIKKFLGEHWDEVEEMLEKFKSGLPDGEAEKNGSARTSRVHLPE